MYCAQNLLLVDSFHFTRCLKLRGRSKIFNNNHFNFLFYIFYRTLLFVFYRLSQQQQQQQYHIMLSLSSSKCVAVLVMLLQLSNALHFYVKTGKPSVSTKNCLRILWLWAKSMLTKNKIIVTNISRIQT